MVQLSMCTPGLSRKTQNGLSKKENSKCKCNMVFFLLKKLYWCNINRNHGVDCQVKQETLLCNLESGSFRGKLTKIVVIGLLDGQVV